jgi:hypothetical protein
MIDLLLVSNPTGVSVGRETMLCRKAEPVVHPDGRGMVEGKWIA